MKSIRFRLLVAGLAVLLGTVLAQSQAAEDAFPPHPMHGHEWGMEPGHMMKFWAEKLNLSEDQKTQMKAVLQKEHSTLKPLFQQEHQIDKELRQYVEGPYDEAKVRALATQKAQVEVESTVQRTRIFNELYQLLTPDQRSQLKQMEANHEERMERHMHQGEQAAPQQ